MSSSAAYMREYRRRNGGTPYERARLAAVDWVREHRPDLWAGMLEQAREDIKNATVPSPSPAASPPAGGHSLGASSPGAVTTDGLSAASHTALPVGVEVS